MKSSTSKAFPSENQKSLNICEKVKVLQDLICQMILKLVPCWQNNIILGNSERPDEFDQKEDNLDATDDGESSEEPHGASDQAKLGLQSDLLVLLNLVVGGRVKVDLDHVQRRELLSRRWKERK